MIRLAAFRGAAFNQNGDLGNLRVFARALTGANVGVSINLDATGREELVRADFLVIGDASLAQQRTHADEFQGLPGLIQERRANGKATLLAGSSFEQLASPIFGLQATTRSERVSAFASCDIGGKKYWGYVNTTVHLPLLVVDGLTLGTQLFGPLLARNPNLIRQLAVGLSLDIDEAYVADLARLMSDSENYRQSLANNLQ